MWLLVCLHYKFFFFFEKNGEKDEGRKGVEKLVFNILPNVQISKTFLKKRLYMIKIVAAVGDEVCSILYIDCSSLVYGFELLFPDLSYPDLSHTLQPLEKSL